MKKNNTEFLAKIQFLNLSWLTNIIKFLLLVIDDIYLFFLKKPRKTTGKKNIIMIANLGLGDLMNFLSVTDKYRYIYPSKKYYITLIVPFGFDKLLYRETSFDEIICVNFNECVTNLKKRFRLYKLINKKYYDILIDIMGATGAAINVYLSHASFANKKITIQNKEYSICPNYLLKKSYTDVHVIYNKNISNVEYYNELVDYIGGKKTKIKLHKTHDYPNLNSIPDKYYIVFPGASSSFRKWDLDNYVQIIKKIYEKVKMPVLFCGTAVDMDSVQYLINNIEDIPYYNILGKTNMLEFIQVIKNASFIITNDTGSYHIAVNEEVPVTIITGSYALDMYALYSFLGKEYRNPYIVNKEKVCKNCFYKCPYVKKGDKVWPCLKEITVDDAWQVIEKMIDNEVNIDENK